MTRGYCVKRHLKQYFSYFVVVSLISGGNRKSYPEKIADLPQNTDVNSYQVVSVWLYCNISLVMNLFISRLVEIYSAYRLSLSVYKLTISIWGAWRVTAWRFTWRWNLWKWRKLPREKHWTAQLVFCFHLKLQIGKFQIRAIRECLVN